MRHWLSQALMVFDLGGSKDNTVEKKEGWVKPDQRRNDDAGQQTLGGRIERRAVKDAGDVAGPQDGNNRESAPHSR